MATRKKRKADDATLEVELAGESGIRTTSGKRNLQKGSCRGFSMGSALMTVCRSFFVILSAYVLFGVTVYSSFCL